MLRSPKVACARIIQWVSVTVLQCTDPSPCSVQGPGTGDDGRGIVTSSSLAVLGVTAESAGQEIRNCLQPKVIVPQADMDQDATSLARVHIVPVFDSTLPIKHCAALEE